nr:Chain BC, mS38 [Polytomella magna]8APN_BD Chain BD, mS38 [Polytomella magna]8APO_BC Chain BC, mS38 [Polytomella magna]
ITTMQWRKLKIKKHKLRKRRKANRMRVVKVR